MKSAISQCKFSWICVTQLPAVLIKTLVMSTASRSVATLAVIFAFGAHTQIFAQESRPCDYLDPVTVTKLLGVQAQLNSKNGQHDLTQASESHRCTWVANYPPVAPGAPPNPATLEVTLTRYPSIATMKSAQLQPQELGPRVKVEKISGLGELGSFIINSDRNVVQVTASKGVKTLSISVDMGLNPLISSAKQNLLTAAEQLFKRL